LEGKKKLDVSKILELLEGVPQYQWKKFSIEIDKRYSSIACKNTLELTDRFKEFMEREFTP
jgi:hypothetical protein